MANESDDNYKEGVDFEWVQGNNDENSGFKTRHFFTKAEKKARSEPTVEAPKASFKEAFAAARKAQGAGGEFTWKGNSYSTNIAGETGKKKLQGLGKPANITVTSLDPDTPPGSKPAGPPMDSTKKAIKNYTDQLNSGKLTDSEARSARTAITRLGGTYKTDALRDQAATQTDTSRYNQGMKELMTGRKGAAAQYKEGGVIKMKEGSAKDMREDKAMAKKSGMTMKQHEASAADKKHDAPNKMAKGGVVKKAMGGTADPAVLARMNQTRPPEGMGTPYGGPRRVAFEGPNDGMPGMRPPKPNMGPMPPRRPMGPPMVASASSTPSTSSTPTVVAPPPMKKGGAVKKAKGGMVRGAGCATRGKTGAKEY